MASAYGVLIGMVDGSIGLGGAEFRLLVPAGLPGYRARQAVAQNVAVTLAMVTAALGTRGGALPLGSLANPIPAMSALLGGSVLGASFGPTVVGRWSDRYLGRVVFVLLVGLGCGLLFDSVLIYEPVTSTTVRRQARSERVSSSARSSGLSAVCWMSPEVNSSFRRWSLLSDGTCEPPAR